MRHTRCSKEHLQLPELKAQGKVLLTQISNSFCIQSRLSETSAKLNPTHTQTSRGSRALIYFSAQQFSLPQQGGEKKTKNKAQDRVPCLIFGIAGNKRRVSRQNILKAMLVQRVFSRFVWINNIQMIPRYEVLKGRFHSKCNNKWWGRRCHFIEPGRAALSGLRTSCLHSALHFSAFHCGRVSSQLGKTEALPLITCQYFSSSCLKL